MRAEATIIAPGRIRAGDKEITADHLIVATGSDAVVPELLGTEQIPIWTNRDVFTVTILPERAVIVGGSAVGTETATFLARFGVEVTLIHRGERLMEREDPRVGELAQIDLEEADARVRLNTAATRGRSSEDGGGPTVDLDDGSTVPADVLVFATGRTPRTAGLGLERAGATLLEGGRVRVDTRCRAADGLWAIGDVTGIMPFTHVAKYQGRIAADSILGRGRDATYEGIPRVVFGDPEIAAVGLTADQAERQGLNVEAVEIDLAHEIARPWTYERDPRGHLGLLADVDRGVLVGGWAVAPLAGEWIHHASLAIRGEIPIATLQDMVPQFPTYHEAYQTALDRLSR